LEIHDKGANEFVVNTIDNGYVIAVIRNPPPMKKNPKQTKIKDVKCHAKGLSKLKHT
jgi:hypothetical protein